MHLTHYHRVPVNRPAAVGDVVELAFRELPNYVLATATDDHAKGAAGYWVAAEVRGPRSNAAAEPTTVIALDYDDAPGGPAWDRLAAWPYFAHTTDSHTPADPRWRVWIHLDRAYAADEVAAAAAGIAAALPGAHLRAISQPVYVPTRGDDIEWVDHTDAGIPLKLADYAADATTATEPTAWTPPASRRRPSAAATNALVTRWVSNPRGTNRLAGATGACLAEWGWSDEDVFGYIETWFAAADPRWRKHADDAVRAARRRRAGDRIVGFPTLAAEGVDFAPDALDDGLWDAATPAVAAPATDDDGWVHASAVAAWDPPPVPWVCEALGLAPGAPGLLTGRGGSGKTTFAQALGVAVASGAQDFLGWGIRAGGVTHLDYEQGPDFTARRYQQLGLGAGASLRFRSWGPGLGADAEARRWVAEAAKGQTLVIVDSLIAGLGAALEDENAAAVREPLDWLGRASAATGACFLVVHHNRKDETDGQSAARGSSAITDAVSVHWTFARPKDDAGGPRVLKAEKVRHWGAELADGLLDIGVSLRLTSKGRLEIVSADAAARAKAEGVANQITLLLADGTPRSTNQIRRDLSLGRDGVIQAITLLIQNGIIARDTEDRLSLVRDAGFSIEVRGDR